jgi:hypothetical protein
LLDNYYKWLQSQTFVSQDKRTNWISISTPFIGLFNDNIEFFVKKKDNEIIFSDDGETLYNLGLIGVNFKKGERKNIFERILLNYGINIKNDELFIKTSVEKFPQKKHNFLSAMMELHDTHVLSNHKVKQIFKEDVRNFLDKEDIIYTPDFISKGETGLEFIFDFQIAHRKQEIVLKSFNGMNKQNLPSFLFAWKDIKAIREKISKKEVKAIAFINDKKIIKKEYVEALNSKNADYILWSKRHEQKNILKLVS